MNIFEEFLARAHWNWATSYAMRAPHWYVVRNQFRNDDLFNKVVEYMREHSVTEYFFSKPFHYFYHEGFKYWTMGNPINETTIINRARV